MSLGLSPICPYAFLATPFLRASIEHAAGVVLLKPQQGSALTEGGKAEACKELTLVDVMTGSTAAARVRAEAAGHQRKWQRGLRELQVRPAKCVSCIGHTSAM